MRFATSQLRFFWKRGRESVGKGRRGCCPYDSQKQQPSRHGQEPGLAGRCSALWVQSGGRAEDICWSFLLFSAVTQSEGKRLPALELRYNGIISE